MHPTIHSNRRRFATRLNSGIKRSLLAESGQKKTAAIYEALPEILRMTARSELPLLFHRGWNVRFRHPYAGDRLHIDPSSVVSAIAVLE